ncbi:MAG TPA: 4-hydroxy-3-methylbut-2-enyl diphosphate reductase [Candidatus Marinimicrobia bacterium]|nr:4-hydroxy-3-methylbut-2-enyl diphosphate reductase [Candidatus Neomarinimicrobiota bacterium]
MNSLTITTAKDVGFCFGVKRAVDIAKKAAETYGKVAMLGNIVHNETVIRGLERAGVVVYTNIDDIPADMPVLFRSHGTPRSVRDRAHERGLTIIDATCPLVEEIHKASQILEKEDRTVIIIGDPGHDEVEGVASQLVDPVIIADADGARNQEPLRKAGVVVQSTQSIDNVDEIVGILITKVYDLRIINTICAPTRNRQQQLMELARQNDVMIIVGSFSSANTRRLRSISGTVNKRSYQVQGPDDIHIDWFKGASSVGISAGASTPGKIVKEVAKKIRNLAL